MLSSNHEIITTPTILQTETKTSRSPQQQHQIPKIIKDYIQNDICMICEPSDHSIFKLGGLTNQNFLQKFEKHSHTNLVLKILAKDVEFFINRKEEEIISLTLSKKGIGPFIYAFLNKKYILMDHYNGEEIPVDELLNTENGILDKVLEQVHDIHQTKINDQISTKPKLLQFLENYSKVRKNLESSLEKNEANLERNDFYMNLLVGLGKLVPFFEIFLKKFDDRDIMLCHNDLNAGNLLKMEDGKVVILDYEYSGYNYQYYEIGNFICECESIYLDEAPYYGYEVLDAEKTDKLLKVFYAKFVSQNPENLGCLNLSFEDFSLRVFQFKLLSYFFWINLAMKTMYLDIEFDFKKYCQIKFNLIKNNFEQYFITKDDKNESPENRELKNDILNFFKHWNL